MFYRFTYEGEGIYNVWKKHVGLETWKIWLSKTEVNWLPKPPIEYDGNRSYFTKSGCERFEREVLPIIVQYLDESKIVKTRFDDIQNILYSDEYQVITN